MTSFVAWTGVDSRGPSSLYFASDSRISWTDSRAWDQGRKVFASMESPELLGYVGDVLFPSLVLGQLCAAIDMRVLCRDGSRYMERFNEIREIVENSFAMFPVEDRHPFTVFYGTREGAHMSCRFHLCLLSWDAANGWRAEDVPMPGVSSVLKVYGSGRSAVQEWQSYWDASSQGRTSRAVFSGFCDAVSSGSDPRTGGAPQLAGVYRKGPAQNFGVSWKAEQYLFGIPVDHFAKQDISAIEWRNHLFERVDSHGERLAGAQAHHAPKGLGKAAG